MATPSIQTLITQAQQVLNLKSSNEIRATLAAVLANANVGTPLNPNLTTQQLWDQFYEIVRQPTDDIESIIADQMMRMIFSPPAPGGAGADKQVIFNDGGVLAGDAGLVYNKTTDALTVGGLVTAGSASITGVATFAAGTALLPALTTSGDTNTGVFYPAADSFGVSTGGLERYGIDATGRSFWYTGGVSSMTLDGNGLAVVKALDAARLNVTGATIPANGVYLGSANNLSFSAASTLAMTIDASGNLLVGVVSANANGGVLQLKSGITFPATQVASSNANTLDDYEEGTFTPTVLGSTVAGVGVYTVNNGFYTKVGNLVTVQVYLIWSALTGGTGDLRFGGLPFAASSETNALSSASIGYVNNITLTASNILTVFNSASNTFLQAYQYPVGGGAASIVPVDLDGGIFYTITYRV